MQDGKRLEGVGLLLVDIQHDFVEGSLPVPEATSIMPTVKRLIEECAFQLIICSQDFHPKGHISFASRHLTDPFQMETLPHPERIRKENGELIGQMLWPDHCIQGTWGCEIHETVLDSFKKKKSKAEVEIVQKGQDKEIDAYSAFSSNEYLNFSRLPKLLFSQRPAIHTLVVVGLATDYCVMSSAIDAVKFNLRTIVILDGIRGAAKDTTSIAYRRMQDHGIEMVQSINDLERVI